jgi:hypothetical protein
VKGRFPTLRESAVGGGAPARGNSGVKKQKQIRCPPDFCSHSCAAHGSLLCEEGGTPRSVLGPDLCSRFHSSHSRLPPFFLNNHVPSRSCWASGTICAADSEWPVGVRLKCAV